jgi:hypothetical protein
VLDPDGVRRHEVSLCVQEWEPPGLPDSFSRTCVISRGDVLDIGEQVREKTLPAADLLVASFVGGWGPAGYGPRRLREICAAAGWQAIKS